MSHKVVRKVLEQSRARGSARMVLVVIAEHANHQGQRSFPGIPTISREANLSERQTYRALRKLVNSGELEIQKEKGPHGTNLYRVPLAPGVTSETARGVTFVANRGDIQGRKGMAPASPKPSEETVKEPSRFHRSNGSDRDPEPFDQSEFLDQMRKRLGKQMTMPGTTLRR